MSSSHYQKSGVDVEQGDALVEWIANDLQTHPQPHAEKILAGVGGFAALFRNSFPHMKKPCLVACTDGVGTKVLVAAEAKKFAGIGQDLVAMCVNDLICTGGQPLFFLDYYAVGRLEKESAQAFLKSVRAACVESDCALIGGETAEMPGVYAPGHFDCAGFAVGIVDEDNRWGAHRVQTGDVLLGVASSGFHSNGYSLLRKVFAADLEQWVDQLLIPTRLYVGLVKALQEQQVEVHAASHITGGGVDNIPRVLPEHLRMHINYWPKPPLFAEVQKRTGMSDRELRQTLNSGVGFVLVLPAREADRAERLINAQFGWDTFRLGEVGA